MHKNLSDTTQIIKLNGERVTRNYTTEISTAIVQGRKTIFSAVGMEFNFTYYGMNDQGGLQYRIEVLKRFLLNERNNIIKKLSKAQTIALAVAAINDVLEIETTKNFQFVSVTNTEEVRKQWQLIKSDLLQEYPDLASMAADFDWQLQEENIQQLFLEDNFFSFFFSNIFYQEFEGNTPIPEHKTLSNALGSITVPIIAQKRIARQDILFEDVTIATSAEMDTAHKTFPLEKMNVFLGQLPIAAGEQHDLDFSYAGIYKVKPKQGLVIEGVLTYSTEVKDLYKKTTTINFNMQ